MDTKLEYQNVASLNVNLNRQNYGPLDVSQVLTSQADFDYYRSGGALCADTKTYPNTPYPYAGQIVSLVDNSNGNVTVYKLVPNSELGYFDAVQIDAAIKPGDLPIEAGTGVYFGTSDNGKITINAQKIDFDKVVDSTTSASDNAAYTSAVYQALTAIDNRVSTGYVPLSVANSATSTDKLQKASDVSSIASSYITSYFDGVAAGSANQTLTGLTTTDGKVVPAYKDISIVSGQVQDISKAIDDKISLSVASLTADAVTAGTGEAITSISQTDGKITASKGKITVASADVTDLSGFVDSKVKAVDDKLTGYAQTSNLNNYIKLSSILSTAWNYKLSAATATDPVVLSSDISGLIAAGVTFGGVVATSANITAGKAGQVYVLTGTAGTTKEGIVTADGSTTGFVELGDEGAVADLASKIRALSTKVDGLSNSISAVKVGTTTLTTTNGQIELTKQTISTLFDASQLCTYTQISTQARKDLSGNLSTDLSLAEYAKTADFTGKVGLSTATQVSAAISGAISSSLNLKALAHKDTVSTADIDNSAVTNTKIADKSVTPEKLSGLFVLSCGDSKSEDVTISEQ